MSLELTVGDTAPTLTGTVNADLTGVGAGGLVVHILRPDGTVISRAGTIVAPATGGTWSLPLQAGDLTVPGDYGVEVQVTFAGSPGPIQTFRKDPVKPGIRTTFHVEDQIA